MLEYLREKTSPRSLFGPESLFGGAVKYATAGFYSGVYEATAGMFKNDEESGDPAPVIQGIPNWLLGIGIVYLAVGK
jgi:hypothetical protein